MDSQYPLNQDDQNRYKRLKLMLNHLSQTQISHIHKVSGSSHSGNVKRRRDTVEKNLDKMFNGDQENDSDTFNPKRTKTEIGNGTIEETKLIPALSSSIQEPFHGFKENETGEETLVNDVSLHNANKELKNGRTIISTLTPKLIHIDDKGNTFGMTSVYASPISDFNSDYAVASMCKLGTEMELTLVAELVVVVYPKAVAKVSTLPKRESRPTVTIMRKKRNDHSCGASSIEMAPFL